MSLPTLSLLLDTQSPEIPEGLSGRTGIFDSVFSVYCAS